MPSIAKVIGILITLRLLLVLFALSLPGCILTPAQIQELATNASTNSPASSPMEASDANLTPNGYPSPWVRCTFVEVIGLTYRYTCQWAKTDCEGGIGDTTLCLSSESPCPEDYGYCAMYSDRSEVRCTGFVDQPNPPLTKPGQCRS